MDDLYLNLVKAQQRMKRAADAHRTEDSFKVNDMVILKLQPWMQHSLARRPYKKLLVRFYGPSRIIQKIGTLFYKLELPESCKVHPVFHISHLKRSVVKWQPPPFYQHNCLQTWSWLLNLSNCWKFDKYRMAKTGD